MTITVDRSHYLPFWNPFQHLDSDELGKRQSDIASAFKLKLDIKTAYPSSKKWKHCNSWLFIIMQTGGKYNSLGFTNSLTIPFTVKIEPINIVNMTYTSYKYKKQFVSAPWCTTFSIHHEFPWLCLWVEHPLSCDAKKPVNAKKTCHR